jgi:hypothetical protein
MKCLSTGIYSRDVQWKLTDVSEEQAASIFKVKE